MDSNHGPSQKKPSDLCHYRQVWLWWRCAGCIVLRLMVDENSGTRSLWYFSGPYSVSHRQFEMESCFERQKKVSVFRPVSCSHDFGHQCYFFFEMLQRLLRKSAGDCLDQSFWKGLFLRYFGSAVISRLMTSLLLMLFVCWVSFRPVFYILTSSWFLMTQLRADCFLCYKSLDPPRCL